MPKLDELKTRIDWLKELFKILAAILVADVVGVSKLYLDESIGILFYLGIAMLGVLMVIMVIVARKIENQLIELRDI